MLLWYQTWKTLTEWNAYPETTKRTILTAKDVVIATLKPGLFDAPKLTYVYADWIVLTPEDQQSKADLPGGVAVKLLKL